ncbi:MAG TPA: hypothetical protein DHW40_00265 [Microbacterium sp.]|nr:hypothetical protein [Microbacterium sp.]
MPHIVAPQIAPCPLPLFRAVDVPHVSRALRRGDVIRLHRGIYAPAAPWRELPPWDRYLARVHAAARIHDGLVFSHESSAALLGLPIFGDPKAVHIVARETLTAGQRTGIRVHRSATDRELVDAGSFALTTAAECAVDLARSRSEIVGLSIADAALRNDPGLTVESLVARNESRLDSRGRRVARWPLHRARAESESTLESASRGVMEMLGYAEPQLQTRFSAAGREDRADFWWADASAVGEADGDLKYDGRFGDPLEQLRRRRERDARLRRRGIRHILHWAWTDVADPDRLDRMLATAGIPRVAPPDHHRLHTARSALGSAARSARQQREPETSV